MYKDFTLKSLCSFKPLYICDIFSFSLFFIIQSLIIQFVKYLGLGIFSFAQISYLASALCHSNEAERVRKMVTFLSISFATY